MAPGEGANICAAVNVCGEAEFVVATLVAKMPESVKSVLVEPLIDTRSPSVKVPVGETVASFQLLGLVSNPMLTGEVKGYPVALVGLPKRNGPTKGEPVLVVDAGLEGQVIPHEVLIMEGGC